MKKHVYFLVFLGCVGVFFGLKVALAQVGPTTVTVTATWTNPAPDATHGPVTSVRVERSTDGGAFVAACSTPTTTSTSSCKDTPQAVGHIYTYRAISINQYGESGPSNTATLAALGPNTPTSFGITFTLP